MFKGAFRIALVASIIGAAAWPAIAEHQSRCQIECTYTRPPIGPNDVFRFDTLAFAVDIASDTSGILGDALSGSNCRMTSCLPIVHSSAAKFEGVAIINDCDQPIPDLVSDLSKSSAALRLCSRTLQIGGDKPDLVASVRSCSPTLIIRIDNAGKGNAGASKTRIEVLATVPIPRTVDTPAILAGDFVDLDTGVLPAFCSTSCALKVIADVEGKVDESDEVNNVILGGCRGKR